MRNKLLLLALLLCLCQVAKAQSSDSAFYRHHIGLNTRVVLDRITDPASRTPMQLLYKYQLSPRSALRAALEGMYATSDSTQSFTDRRDEITDYVFGGSVGYERQRPLNKIFMLYYGVDAFYRRDGKKIETLNRFTEPNPSQDQVEVHVDDRYATATFGLRPFVGLRANISKRFYLSTETALSLRREKSTQDYVASFKTYSNDGTAIGSPRTTKDYTTNRTNFSFVPISGINLYWLF